VHAPPRPDSILILDELDSLVAVPVASTSASSSSSSSAASGSPSTLSPSLLLLQTLFLLPTTTANLALLAISNTLDFASRYLGTLPCPPQTLAFAAYDASQMSAIILDRLAGLTEVAAPGGEPEVVVVIEDKAVELAARKVMAENGDLRLCLDVVRLAVELVEVEWKKASLAATAVGSGTATVVPIKKAGMTHVLKALQKAKAVACASRTAGGATAAAAGGGLAAGGVRTVDGVPRTPSKKTANAGTVQKLVLVALVIHLRRASLGLAPLSSSSSSTTSSAASSAERTTSGALLSTYSYLLSSADSPVHALSPSDFHTVLALLADAALVSLDQASPAKRRTPASALVQLACLEDEVVKGLVGGANQTAGTGGVEEEEARRILEREEGRMDRLRTRLGKERKMEKACALEDRL
jgi:cell division control protein 6